MAILLHQSCVTRVASSVSLQLLGNVRLLLATYIICNDCFIPGEELTLLRRRTAHAVQMKVRASKEYQYSIVCDIVSVAALLSATSRICLIS
mmetsp:Transcript_11291/g.23100  ORF Transcript_11291/g.23100 Transcript_11291/m.23100 type:complete len:92 (+) Transcript_11291:2023-2298(+)